jgi:hypothetical protein
MLSQCPQKQTVEGSVPLQEGRQKGVPGEVFDVIRQFFEKPADEVSDEEECSEEGGS